MHNMEVFGNDSPTGTALTAGTLNAPTQVSIATGGTTNIDLINSGGNIGIVITSLEITGTNAANFSVTDQYRLVKSGETFSLPINHTGSAETDEAQMVITYNDGETKAVNLSSSAAEPALAYRVNSGGSVVNDAEGNWEADQAATNANGQASTGSNSQYFDLIGSGNIDYTYGINTPASFTNNTGYPDELFYTERYHNEIVNTNNGPMRYSFPADGIYEVRLLFAEIWDQEDASAGNNRIFDVQIEGTEVLTDYRPSVDGTEPFIARAEVVTNIEVTDGSLTIDFLNQNENAAIKAIEVIDLNGTVGETNNPPMGTDPGTQTHLDGDIGINIPISATDGDDGSQTLTYSATGLPPGLTIDLITGIISGDIDDCATSGGEEGAFIESNGLVLIEAESNPAVPQWSILEDGGVTYQVGGSNNFGNSNAGGKINYEVQITTPGVYRFHMKSAFGGSDGTEENDTWFKINNTSDVHFFCKQGSALSGTAQFEDFLNNGTVASNFFYPKGNSQGRPDHGNENPGNSGFFKLYRSGGGGNKWDARTIDNNGFPVYAYFPNAGTFTIEMALLALLGQGVIAQEVVCVASGSGELSVFGKTFEKDNADTGANAHPTRTNGKTYTGYSGSIDDGSGTALTGDDLTLFQKEIYGGKTGSSGKDPSFFYEVPVSTSGAQYQVNLYFAEVYHPSSGGRIFDVMLEDVVILDEYDLVDPAKDGLAQNQTAITRTYFVQENGDGNIKIQIGPASTDNGKLSGFCITEVTGENILPAANIGNLSVDVGEPANAPLNITDPEDDVLTVELNGLPGSLSYNASTNQIEGTPTAGQAGTYTINAIIDDGNSSPVTEEFELVINPPASDTAPTISGIPATPVEVVENASALVQNIVISDDNNSATASVIIYDKSVPGTNTPFTPGAVVPSGEYSFTNTGGDNYQLEWNNAGPARSYEVRITADDGVNNEVEERFDINIGQPIPTAAPDHLQAQRFPNPEPWYDNDPEGSYSIAIETTATNNIGWIEGGEFVEYLVDVQQAGSYDITVYAGKGNSGTANATLSIDGTNLGTVSVVNNGDWQSYNPYVISGATISNTGLQTLRLDFSGGMNIDYIEFEKVEPNQPPVITLTGANPQEIIEGTSYTELGATATDTEDGDISGSIVIDASSVDVNTIGTYQVTYNVDDSEGLSATEVTRTVNVVAPNEAPVITLTGDNPQEIIEGTAYTELGATATDPEDGDISGDIVIDATAVDVNTVGSYQVTYNVDDSEGLAATEELRTVNVVAPNEAPVITLTGANPQEIIVGTAYTELGATATDTEDGDISGSIVIDASSVDINTIGTYQVTYNVDDSEGLAATAVTRTVNVVAPNQSPVITPGQSQEIKRLKPL